MCWAHAKALGAPAETILGLTDVIGGNLEIIVNVLGPYRSTEGACRDKSWAQVIHSVELILNALGPCKSIGCSPRQFWARPMPSVETWK